MVNKINIKNFKSVYDLEIELGRFNVFIGENGCGKTNILEAIAFGGAASADLLFNEFFSSRGLRVSDPKLVFSAFDKQSRSSQNTILRFEIDKELYAYKIGHSVRRGWHEEYKNTVGQEVLSKYESILTESVDEGNEGTAIKIKSLLDMIPEKDRSVFVKAFFEKSGMPILDERFFNQDLSNFLIYSPENTYLRYFYGEAQIEPLGIKGEGLFKQLKFLNEHPKKNKIQKIINNLKILDWFNDFEIPKEGFPGENYIGIKDKYFNPTAKILDQNLANEGFLFLLFYFTLFISDDTPRFFAIDNLDSTFNPKLCTEFTKTLTKLSKEHKKQAIVTTHNPFILDGLDLSDDNQRLFVVRRNLDGHTIATRIKPDKPLSYKLSEAWMNGYIGGLPNNF